MTKETQLKMITDYTNGSSILDLAKTFNLGQKKIRDMLFDAGVLRSRAEGIAAAWRNGKKSQTPEWHNSGKKIDENEVINLHSEGLTCSAIAHKLQIAASRVRLVLVSRCLVAESGKYRCLSCNEDQIGSAQRKFCKDCIRDAFHRRFTKFGVGRKRWNEMLSQQGGHCALCPREAIFVDHDHATNAVRGILCNGCNSALGQVDRDPDWSSAALEYSKRGRDVKSHLRNGINEENS